MAGKLAKVLDCTSHDEIEKLKKECTTLTGPVTDLLSVCKQSINDMKKATKARDTWRASQKAQQPKKKPRTGQPSAGTLFEEAPKYSEKFPTVHEGEDLSAVDFGIPLLITALPDKKLELESDKD